MGVDETITFNMFSFSVDCLDEWVGVSGINVNYDYKKNTANISYEKPKKIKFTLDNEMELQINFTYSLPKIPAITEAKITQKAYFILRSKELRGLDDFIIVAHKITNLMCFAMDETVTITNVFATSSEIQNEENDPKYPAKIKVYYQSIPYSEKVPKQNRHEMLFTFEVIKNDVQKIFNSWINTYEDLFPAFSLYFSTQTDAQKYLDGKFLALVQGLETYHRRTSDETLMNEDIFQSLVSNILATCPKEHQKWLEGRLMYGNEINLGKRLKKVIEPFKDFFGTNEERKKLLRRIVNTRNYLTHYNKNLKDKSATGRDLWILYLNMELIFQFHFLSIIGFTKEDIEKVVENCSTLKSKIEEIKK